MNKEKSNKTAKIFNMISIAIGAVIIASFFRKFLLYQLENQVVWITFYPATMAASVFGGFISGVIAAILSVIIVLYYWSFFTVLPFLPSGHVSTINIIVFLFNSILISLIAEYSRIQRKKSEENRIKAEEANNAKTIFLANISHEIRTPLNAILGFSQILLRNPSLTEDEKKQVKLINTSGNHLLTLINDILDISKIEFGKMEIINNKFDFIKLIHDVENMFTIRAKEKNIEFFVEFNKETPKYIVSDEKKIKQILVNLLGNAIKFTDTGSVTLNIHTEKDKGSLYKITFTISDTGIGIRKEEIDKIFDNFFQASNSRNGTGLGLSITKKIIVNLNSDIKVESALGKGSKFSFCIEVKGLLEELNNPNQDLIYKYKNMSDETYKALIVDDILDNIILLETLLKNLNFQVHSALSAEEGIKKADNNNFDVIFMDILLPDLNGNEVIKRIRSNTNKKQPIIIGVSASIFKEEIKDVLDAGADDFLSKPINIDDLCLLLIKYLKLNLVKIDITLDESNILPEKSFEITDELKEKFLKAIEEGEFLKISTLIEELGDNDKQFKIQLREALDFFDYERIKEIIDSSKKTT